MIKQQQQLKAKELILLNTVKVNESNYGGNYKIETESNNITATLLYPTPKDFDRFTTMALNFNGDTGVIVTYNFNEKRDLDYLLELIEPSDISENYWYTPSSNQYQVLLHDNIRLFLQKNSIEELYTILNKIKAKLLELGIIN